jgi:phage terminase large subunit
MPEIQQIKIQVPREYQELWNPNWRNILYYGGRYSGKSYTVSQHLLLKGRESKRRILCTRQIQNTIADSVHKLLKDQIAQFGFDDYVVTKDSIFNQVTGTEFIFKGLLRNIQEIKSLEGIDDCWVEEAQSATNESLDILTPTIRKPGSRLIYTFNRFTELDPVYVRYVMSKPPRTFSSQVNYDVMEKYGFLSPEIKEEIEYEKKNNPALFAHKYLGEPLSQNEFAAIPRDDILKAMQHSVSSDGAFICGIDMARMGNDRIVFWLRKGLKTLKYKVMNKQSIDVTCDILEDWLRFNKEVILKIDDTGVGGGATDIMKRRGWKVYPVNFGGSPQNTNRYPNWISEAWFHFADIVGDSQLPMDRELLQELTTRQWKVDDRGRRRIESKDDYKKRGYTSPDLADACIICYSEFRSAGNSGAVKHEQEHAEGTKVFTDGTIQAPDFWEEFKLRAESGSRKIAENK